MARPRFQLNSDQLELLLAFEQIKGLRPLADFMGRDPSVISRNLQRMAEDFPVLAKINGRWELTALGKQINEATRKFIEIQNQTLARKDSPVQEEPYRARNALLMVINAQKGLLDPALGGRNNLQAEKNIESLLRQWRSDRRPILHVKHVSENPKSLFYTGSEGCQFLPSLSPTMEETVLEKRKSSAFTDTNLNETLQTQDIGTLILVGFTANECIDATARDAAELGFTTYVVNDATAMFDITGPDGKLIKADRIHKLTLANIHSLCAQVITTSSLLL
jgi:nicotinamidase-related amidase